MRSSSRTARVKGGSDLDNSPGSSTPWCRAMYSWRTFTEKSWSLATTWPPLSLPKARMAWLSTAVFVISPALLEIDGFSGYYKVADPGIFENCMLMGINVPIRIGNTTIMPGDVVLGGPEGVTFIPPQLAGKVVDTANMIHLKDEWGHAMLRERKYTPGQIDSKWSPAMEEDFHRWLVYGCSSPQ